MPLRRRPDLYKRFMNKLTGQNPTVLSLWQNVNIVLERDGKRSEFVSRIEDIRRGSYSLEMPIRQGGDLTFRKGDRVEISFSRKDAVYSFKASILDLFDDDRRTVTISQDSEILRAQRRKFVRLDISGTMTFRELGDTVKANVCLGAEFTGNLLNISAGGVLFESPARLRNDSFVVMSFSLKGRHSLNNILAAVKRVEGSRNKGFLVGAEFLTRSNMTEHGLEKILKFLPPGTGTFDENLQKLVMQFIYTQQVEMRKENSAVRRTDWQ